MSKNINIKRDRIKKYFFAVMAILILGHSFAADAEIIRPITFPARGIVHFSDDFGDSRSGGRTHEGNDIIGPKMTPLVSAVNGRISSVVYPEASWGYAIIVRDSEGWSYHYLHVNNDTPGTDDGSGGADHAYASGILPGVRVEQGDLLGWMGDSGNAEWVGSHLHFEIRMPDGTAVNPYPSLVRATLPGGYDPVAAATASPDINIDKGLVLDATQIRFCISGTLIKSTDSDAVYYCGADGKRYVFPNAGTYASWYEDFLSVQTISPPELAAVSLGKNVTYRPGVKLVKIQSDPHVYAVAPGGELRWVSSPEIAQTLYGERWVDLVQDLPVTFFGSYHVGDPIDSIAPQTL